MPKDFIREKKLSDVRMISQEGPGTKMMLVLPSHESALRSMDESSEQHSSLLGQSTHKRGFAGTRSSLGGAKRTSLTSRWIMGGRALSIHTAGQTQNVAKPSSSSMTNPGAAMSQSEPLKDLPSSLETFGTVIENVGAREPPVASSSSITTGYREAKVTKPEPVAKKVITSKGVPTTHYMKFDEIKAKYYYPLKRGGGRLNPGSCKITITPPKLTGGQSITTSSALLQKRVMKINVYEPESTTPILASTYPSSAQPSIHEDKFVRQFGEPSSKQEQQEAERAAAQEQLTFQPPSNQRLVGTTVSRQLHSPHSSANPSLTDKQFLSDKPKTCEPTEELLPKTASIGSTSRQMGSSKSYKLTPSPKPSNSSSNAAATGSFKENSSLSRLFIPHQPMASSIPIRDNRLAVIEHYKPLRTPSTGQLSSSHRDLEEATQLNDDPNILLANEQHQWWKRFRFKLAIGLVLVTILTSILVPILIKISHRKRHSR